jgi:hypothetical protein
MGIIDDEINVGIHFMIIGFISLVEKLSLAMNLKKMLLKQT